MKSDVELLMPLKERRLITTPPTSASLFRGLLPRSQSNGASRINSSPIRIDARAEVPRRGYVREFDTLRKDIHLEKRKLNESCEQSLPPKFGRPHMRRAR